MFTPTSRWVASTVLSVAAAPAEYGHAQIRVIIRFADAQIIPLGDHARHQRAFPDDRIVAAASCPRGNPQACHPSRAADAQPAARLSAGVAIAKGQIARYLSDSQAPPS
jgi:hypothetical protein